MNIKICTQCHKFFSRIGEGNLCASCQKEDYNLLQNTKNYLDTHPQATLEELSQENNVSISKLKSYLRDNRLQLPLDSPIKLYCKQCNTPILSGQLCPSCRNTLKHALKIAAQSIQTSQTEEQSKKSINKGRGYHTKPH